jgi:hypothetical protein
MAMPSRAQVATLSRRARSQEFAKLLDEIAPP